MSLSSAKKIVRRSWDIIPMPQTVIDRVNYLGRDQPQQFIFTNRKGELIGDVVEPYEADDHDASVADEITGVDGGIETPQYPEAIPETQEIDINDLNIDENNPMIDPEPGIEVEIIPDASQDAEPVHVAQVPDTKVETEPLTTSTHGQIPGV